MRAAVGLLGARRVAHGVLSWPDKQLVAQLLAMALLVDVARVCLFFSPQGGPPDFDAYATMPPPSSSSTGWRSGGRFLPVSRRPAM